MERTRDSHSHQRHCIFAWLLPQLFTSIPPFVQHVHGYFVACHRDITERMTERASTFPDCAISHVSTLFCPAVCPTRIVPLQQSQGWRCHCRRKNPPFSYESTLLVSVRWDAWDCVTVRNKGLHFFRLSYHTYQRPLRTIIYTGSF